MELSFACQACGYIDAEKNAFILHGLLGGKICQTCYIELGKK